MTVATLDQILSLAHQLPRPQRSELIARLAHELAIPESAAHATAGDDPWAAFLDLAADPDV